MANYGQRYYRVFNEFTGAYESSGIESITSNGEIVFLSAENKNTWEQIGIQAPPGTRFSFDGGITKFIMGRTGVYELSNVSISSLMFFSEKEYQKDEIATQALILEAERMQKAAKEYYKYISLDNKLGDAYYELWLKYYNGDENVKYIYENNKVTFLSQNEVTESTVYTYQGQSAADEVFLRSKWGVYNTTEQYIQLENIIVDYLDTNG